MDYKIEYVSVGKLTPYAKNAKKHPKEQVERIKESITRFGFRQNLVIDDDNVVVIGHGRLLAAKDLGIDKVPCIRVSDLTEEEVNALRLADNKVAESEWDFDLLDASLAEIGEIDMSKFGFDLLDDEIETKDEIKEDDGVPEQVETKAKLGDLWLLGNSRLICGDSADPLVVDRLLDGAKVDMVFTDPPYGMDLDTDYSDMKSNIFKGGVGGKKYEQGRVDEFHPEMINAVFTIDADEMFLWGADYFAESLPNKNDGSWIVWDKRANGNDDVAEDYSSDRMFGSCFELCWSKKKHKRDIARIKWAGAFGLEQEFDRKRWHPTQKPTKLAGWFLERYSKEGQVVVDLFGGSGSTLIACEQLGRRCFMAELDPKYCDVIIQRYINLKSSADDVYLIRDGKRIGYEDVVT